MTCVTICIPAYRAEAFISQTLLSVQKQSHHDLRIEIAIDPSNIDSPDGTRDAIEPFLSDDRVHLRENPVRLGWDGNINAMLKRVDTPYYMILPHDDLIDLGYVEILLSVLKARPDASVAYGDMTFHGKTSRTHKTVYLPPDGTRDEQLLTFFLEGAEAVPWRGVTRVSTIAATGGFPTDEYQGFAVENEYALSLLLHGRAVRVPRPLYSKQEHPLDVPTASRNRIRELSHETLTQAWQQHRFRMITLLDNAHVKVGAELVRLAAEAAMLRRYSIMVAKVLPAVEVTHAHHLLQRIDHLSTTSTEALRIAMLLHWVLAQHESGLWKNWGLAPARIRLVEKATS